MKPVVLYAVAGGGAFVLFVGSFLGFAVLSGTPLNEIALVKNFVAAPPKDAEHGSGDRDSGENTTDEAKATLDEPGSLVGGQISALDHAKPIGLKADSEQGGSAASAVQPSGSVHSSLDRAATKSSQDAGSKHGTSSASTASVLASFVLPAGFSTTELSDLQNVLHEKRSEYDRRMRKVEDRERQLVDWERSIEGRLVDLETLKTLLEKKESDLRLRESEVVRDEKAKLDSEATGWKDMAKFFVDGEPAELVKKLLTYEPRDAAKILREIEEKRASEIVNALPPDKFKAYMEAYRTVPR